MARRLPAAALGILLLMATPALARPNPTPCLDSPVECIQASHSTSLVSPVVRGSRHAGRQRGESRPSLLSQIGRPARYIGGRLVCAINVNAALAERGIRGTGSALAKSFLNWGHSTTPVPGAVAVYNRGGRGKGHVAIVSRVDPSGQVYVWNPGRGGWREVAYRKRAIAYRIAS